MTNYGQQVIEWCQGFADTHRTYAVGARVLADDHDDWARFALFEESLVTAAEDAIDAMRRIMKYSGAETSPGRFISEAALQKSEGRGFLGGAGGELLREVRSWRNARKAASE